MKILLSACLALVLGCGAPAFAAATPPQTGHTTAAPQGGTDNQGARQRVHHERRPFVAGERVRPRLLGGRHVVTDYAKFRVDPPTGGDRWVKARGQLLLVSADGVIRTVVPRHRGHRHRNAPQNDDQRQ